MLNIYEGSSYMAVEQHSSSPPTAGRENNEQELINTKKVQV